jgi:hypothetical protein
MKDLPHHMKKLNRRVIRSVHREEAAEAEMPEIPNWKPTKQSLKKKAKIQMRDKTLGRAPTSKTESERNWEMKKRVPVFDQNNGTRKIAKPTKKKTPRI